MSLYFTNHFYFGSKINSINISGKTLDEAKKQIVNQIHDYTLTLKERGGRSEEIRSADIGLMYNPRSQYRSLKQRQNPLKWMSALLYTEDFELEDMVLYDEKLLQERVDKLLCFDGNCITEPKSPSIKYTADGYVIVDGINGNKVNKRILYNNVAKAIIEGDAVMDLETSGCYEPPKYISSSPKVIQCKDTLNKYISSEITYNFGNDKEIIDRTIINKWLKITEDFEVIVDKEKEKIYLGELLKKYNTLGKTRNFVTSSGKAKRIGKGDYGWLINRAKEMEALNLAIKKGQTTAKEPAYIQTAACHGNSDIGRTYVEIDITKQHLWFYKNGALIVQGDIVTGDVSSKHPTPEGVYRLKYKQKSATLKGQDYNTDVSFWMPFNGNIGIHDASWRRKFGGDIYKRNGSHGCINAPYSVAKIIFGNIDKDVPIICYY